MRFGPKTFNNKQQQKTYSSKASALLSLRREKKLIFYAFSLF